MTRVLHLHRQPGTPALVDMVASDDVELHADRDSGRFYTSKRHDQELSSAKLIELLFDCDLIVTW